MPDLQLVAAIQSQVPPTQLEASQKLSFTDAAEVVLERFANKRPMHYRAIMQKILDLGLVQTKGQTPEATLYAQVLTETKRRIRRGDSPRSRCKPVDRLALRSGRQTATWPSRSNSITTRYARTACPARTMSPADFEALIGQLLVALGFKDVNARPTAATTASTSAERWSWVT